jgi:hypothetical protein
MWKKGAAPLLAAFFALALSGAECGPDGQDDAGDGGDRGDADAKADAKSDADAGADDGAPADAGPPCVTDFDCISPWVCEETHCAPPCGAERACEQGYLCTAATGHCEVDPECQGITWRTFVRGFTQDYCVRCHAGYSELEIVRSIAPAIRAQVVNGLMPESCPCPTPAERNLLGVWIGCDMPR